MLHFSICAGVLVGLLPVLGFTQENAAPSRLLTQRSTAVNSPVVDVGYGKYQGYYNETSGFYIYRGVRYAKRPERWQLPQPPEARPEIVSQAVDDPPRCPQAPLTYDPSSVDFDTDVYGNEDCLFLNVFTPADSDKLLPVMFFIHGGAYLAGSAVPIDFTEMAHRVDNGFVTVGVQYRLGAFGFASSEEIKEKGVLNAGLHDLQFALEWVQEHIESFGGDPDQVTIAGESAGGGAVMLLAMANGGKVGTRLFTQLAVSSPYLPTQPDYNDALIEGYYQQFAQRSGCTGTKDTWFKCLSEASTLTLQKANALTNFAAKFGQWAHIPVTDGTLLKDRPSQQLLKGQLSGERLLAGSNANEGFIFVPQNITTQKLFQDYIRFLHPHLTSDDLSAIMNLYAVPSSFNASGPKYNSNGIQPPWATEISQDASGWQQAANNLYAEATFVCPAYWLGDAFSPNSSLNSKGKSAWRYQYSVPDAVHAADVAPFIQDPKTPGTTMNQEFRESFQTIWGRFVTRGDPTLSVQGGTGLSAANKESWFTWGTSGQYTGGQGDGYPMLNINVTSPESPGGSRASWHIVDGNAWEDHRAARCALWAKLGAHAQE